MTEKITICRLSSVFIFWSMAQKYLHRKLIEDFPDQVKKLDCPTYTPPNTYLLISSSKSMADSVSVIWSPGFSTSSDPPGVSLI